MGNTKIVTFVQRISEIVCESFKSSVSLHKSSNRSRVYHQRWQRRIQSTQLKRSLNLIPLHQHQRTMMASTASEELSQSAGMTRKLMKVRDHLLERERIHLLHQKSASRKRKRSLKTYKISIGTKPKGNLREPVRNQQK